MSTALVLFRRDLRLTDNPALSAACAGHDRVLPVFVHAPSEETPWQPGAAGLWWLHHALEALRVQLAAQGADLHVLAGNTLDRLREVVRATGATAIYWNRRYEPAGIACDTALKAALREDGLQVHSHAGNLWHEPWALATDAGQPYRVFTPYWRKLRTRLPEERARQRLRRLGYDLSKWRTVPHTDTTLADNR